MLIDHVNLYRGLFRALLKRKEVGVAGAILRRENMVLPATAKWQEEDCLENETESSG